MITSAAGHKFPAAGIGGGYQGKGTVKIGGHADVEVHGFKDAGSAAIGGGRSGAGADVDIIIGGSAVVTAFGNTRGAGIGGCGDGDGLYPLYANALPGVITIKDGAKVTAQGGNMGAGIGAGNRSGNYQITIRDNAEVSARSGDVQPGIGGGGNHQGLDVNSTVANNFVTILGSAKVYAEGGYDEARDGAWSDIGGGGAAGIGTGDGCDESDDSSAYAAIKITIGSGSDYPTVIARSAPRTGFNGIYASAIGISGGWYAQTDPSRILTQIEIKSGFVVAKRMHDHPEGVDIGGGTRNDASAGGNSYVRISGGSVYAGNGLVSPAPTQSNGTTTVYPLYAPAVMGGLSSGWAITLLGNKYPQVNADYNQQSLSRSQAAYLANGLSGLFPAGISAVLWFPEGTYSEFKVVTYPAPAYTFTATVRPVIIPYTPGGYNRLLNAAP
jgi:hypothetical protein